MARKRPNDPARRLPTRKKNNKRTTQMLMQVTAGRGWHNWVTFRLPAWLAVGFLLIGLLCVLTLIFSPDFAARVTVSVYEALRRLTQ
jgi:hypothetical protein